ncbi:exonuclease domain-containing protein [Trinickia soli]|uniref:DNA-directed DNA polymerase n=1 Tax=Trinickia soli TaxID=380675 RepID=A0A2N7WC60_9BURK|nr:exonuclease domain-containing protein [Trinickia soli]KAA0088701.1 DNA polymerase III subunit epsilon [Paraburkholderia sp. T12-10]PMS27000.1 DNA polymerase III subunit epsilon [Trinickia soli]CAB3710972.1 3'-5' exonuclease DinG [Trinickia soli]
MSDFLSPSPVIDSPIAFVDLETTGGSVAEHRITEIGVVQVGPAGVSRWSTLVNPLQPIPPFIQSLTGITDEMVRDAPTFESFAPALFARLEGSLFIAHNASFDRGFLRSEFQRAGVAFHPDVLCTVKLSRALWPHEKRHGLDALIERHALEPMARHRALADADLLWQFWRRLHALWPLDVLRAHVDRTMRRYRIAGDITEDMLDTAPAGHGVYAFFDASDTPLYVGRSVRLRQRVRAHLAGDRRSAREIRIAEQVRRVQWRATGGELGALLTEAQWVSALRPVHNRQPRFTTPESVGAPWPFDMAAVFEEQGDEGQPGTFHVVHRWCYLGAAASMEAARALAAGYGEPVFEPSTFRILQGHLARGLRLTPLPGEAGAPPCQPAGLTANPPPEPVIG